MLHSYLAALKSVRVIVFPSSNEPAINELGCAWLPRHFAPSQVGLPPSLGTATSRWQSISTLLNYPHGSTARIFTELSPDVAAEVRDALVLASCYIAPVLVLGIANWERLAPYALWHLGAPRLLDETDALKALQVAMTAVARWFPYAHETYHAILDYIHGDLQVDALDIMREKRRILVTRDARQLFGDLPHSPQGTPFVFIADPFNLLLPWLRTMKRAVVAQLPWDDFASTGLGLVAGVVLTAETLQRFMSQASQGERPAERPRHRRFHPSHRPRP
jgi:hypothetical protein